MELPECGLYNRILTSDHFDSIVLLEALVHGQQSQILRSL